MGLIGTSIERAGGVERVTGAQAYTADLRVSDRVLHAKLCTLDCAHAHIRSVDASLALAVNGVRGVFTAADFGERVPTFGPMIADRPIIADHSVQFFGETVAVVLADTEDAAAAARDLVRIEFEERQAVLSLDSALAADAPLVRDPSSRPQDPLARTNTLRELHFGWGGPDIPDADCVVEQDYAFPMVTHFAIEPHAYLAAPDGSGVTIWSPTQHPFVLQRVVSAALRLPIARVRIIAPDPGGGFGGKGWPKFEPLLAALALKTGSTIRLVLTLEETFQAVRRASCRVHARTGFTSGGRIVFQDLAADFLIGAYADVAVRVVSKGSYAACGPYLTPHARVVARAVLSHTTPSTAFRGFGTPQASWAVESQLNEAAARLGIDRVEIRRRNLPAAGQQFIPNDTPADGDWADALARAASAIGWTQAAPTSQPPQPSDRLGATAAPAIRTGRGISLGIKASSTASASYALVRLHYDGSATVFSGTSDMGQGARTVLVQIAAHELGLSPDRVATVTNDTAIVPFDTSTSASRSTVFMGNAIVKSCTHIKQQLRTIAARVLAVDEAAVDVRDGIVQASGRSLTFAEVLSAHFGPTRGELIGVGEERSPFDATHPLGGNPAFWEFMAAAAEVAVDVETGMTRITRIVLVSDVGKAVNPMQVEAQDEGAAVMGIGHTLMEHLLLDDRGRIRNLGALDYRIPTIQDIALHLQSTFIENGDGPGPYGAKGAGEGGILAIAAAIGSAVAEATGVSIRELPLTPERIWHAMQQARAAPDARSSALATLAPPGHR